jgi:outer membrane receptor protein involved in Fe transport
MGSIDWNLAGSLTTKAGGQDSPILPSYNCAGYFGGPCGQQIPRWSHSLRTTYASPGNAFTASLNWRYVGPMTNVSNSGRSELGGGPGAERTTFYYIPGYSYFDLALSYRVSSALSLRLASNNLFDKPPPILANSYNIGLSRTNTLPARYDSLGRQIALGASLSF